MSYEGAVGHSGGRLRHVRGRLLSKSATGEAADCRACQPCDNCTAVAIKPLLWVTPFCGDNDPSTCPVNGGSLLRFAYHGDPFGTTGESMADRIYDTGVPIPDSDPPATYKRYARRVNCSKLFVIKNVRYVDNAPHPDDLSKTQDYVLHTNGAGVGFWGAGPNGEFRAGYVAGTEETPPSGTGEVLDYEPYWYRSCTIGGYALATSWLNLTVEELDARRDETSTVLADGRYTHLVLLNMTKWKKRPADGGTIIVPENKGSVGIVRWHAIRTV